VIEVLDWRDRQTNPPALVRGKRKHLLAGGKVVVRDPKTITGIVIHQTACTFGPSDNAERRHARALGVACHALAFRDRTVVLANPLRWYVQHGNGFNDYSLGLEIEGRCSGLVDDPTTAPREDLETTWGGPPDDVTDDVVAAARVALDELVRRGREEGMPLEYVWAHRQSGPDRRSDPGEELWRRVVLEHAVPVLGLRTQPGLVVVSKKQKARKSPRPIPLAWDPAGIGRY
jgi:hypothetical protein